MTDGDLGTAIQQVSLRSLLQSLESGSRPRGGVRGISEGVVSIGGEHLTPGGGFAFDDVRYVPKEFYQTMRRGHVRRGDILIVKDGATTGKVSLVRSDFPFGTAVVNEHVFVCRPGPAVSPDYLFWFLHSDFGQARILEHFRGSAQGGITQDFADRTFVPVIPRGRQDRSVALMNRFDEMRSSVFVHLRAAAQGIERFRMAVLTAACSGQLTEDWRRLHPELTTDGVQARVEELRDRRNHRRPVTPIAEENLPAIPSSWRWMSVDALASAVVDGVHKTPQYVADGIPFITVRNLTAGPEISFEQTKFITEQDHRLFSSRTKPERGDLLISKDGTIGVVRQIRTNRDFSIFVSVALVKPLLAQMSDYLELALASPQVHRQMVGVGSGLVHLVIKDLKADGVPVPPLEEQDEIVKIVNAIMIQTRAIDKRVRKIEHRVSQSSKALMNSIFESGPNGSSPAW